jgi:hypothetical protein
MNMQHMLATSHQGPGGRGEALKQQMLARASKSAKAGRRGSGQAQTNANRLRLALALVSHQPPEPPKSARSVANERRLQLALA